MFRKHFSNPVLAFAALLAATVFAVPAHAASTGFLANYWPWMALGAVLIVLAAIALFARRLSSGARN